MSRHKWLTTGAFLRRARRAKGLSADVVAQRLNYQWTNSLVAIECGFQKPPLRRFAAFAKVYGVKIEKLAECLALDLIKQAKRYEFT